jgi:uncharacterized Ntn-hydrolase superfamily protein
MFCFHTLHDGGKMKNRLLIELMLVSAIVARFAAFGQDTFSIVAVDSITGQVGSAGASCLAGSIIISDVHPGVGVIHTQSYWHLTNQNYARALMNQGHSPQQIIDSLVAHDAERNPSTRQYGVVDLVGGGRSAAYTGVNCLDYKNHILGQNYAIQGNILLAHQILELMEVFFLSTAGTFTDRLMAALQAAKVPGADIRCLSSGRSSISAFIRTARPQDTSGTLYLNLNVNDAPYDMDPIDSLQRLYDIWKLTNDVSEGAVGVPVTFVLHQNYPNPFNPTTEIRYQTPEVSHVTLKVFDVLGREVATLVNEQKSPGTYTVQWDATGSASGVYFYRLSAGGFVESKKCVVVK